jgi:hypothetical protein
MIKEHRNIPVNRLARFNGVGLHQLRQRRVNIRPPGRPNVKAVRKSR